MNSRITKSPNNDSSETTDHAHEGQMIKLFIDRGANVNLQCEGGSFPLHYAAIAGNVQACKLLLQAGARINATDFEKTTV